jgi:hypothetical protein
MTQCYTKNGNISQKGRGSLKKKKYGQGGFEEKGGIDYVY